MTFPYSGGTLPDPWSDGELVNAAALKSRTTDKLNALADALLVKTARVACDFTCTNTGLVTNTLTNLPVATITSQVGGTFSIVSAIAAGSGIAASVPCIQVPGPGVYELRVSLAAGTQFTVRAFTQAHQATNGKLVGRQPFGVAESDLVLATWFTVTGAVDNKIMLSGYQNSGGSWFFNAISGSIVKVSD